MPGYKIHPEFHADSLVPIQDGLKEFETRRVEPEPDHFLGQTAFYEVDHLAARRLRYRRPEYFVMYKGYGVAEGEWIKESILVQDCPDLINEYRSIYYKVDDQGNYY